MVGIDIYIDDKRAKYVASISQDDEGRLIVEFLNDSKVPDISEGMHTIAFKWNYGACIGEFTVKDGHRQDNKIIFEAVKYEM